MIDEKKIEEAASGYSKTLRENQVLSFAYRDFKAGVHWAQEEFKKSLWHDRTEEPNKDANCLVYISCEYEDTPEDNYKEYTTSMYLGGDWSEDHFPSEADVFILKWCYLDDILPQKGGGNV